MIVDYTCSSCYFFHECVYDEWLGESFVAAYNVCEFWSNGCTTSPDGFCSNYVKRISEECAG